MQNNMEPKKKMLSIDGNFPDASSQAA